MSKTWFRLRNTFEAYAERLPSAEADRMSAFFVQRITSRFRPATEFSLATYMRKQQDRVKAKVDAVHAHLQRIRFLSSARLNQVRRLYEAAEATVAKVTSGEQQLPYEFSYEETAFSERGRTLRQRVRLRLWDFVAAYDRSVVLGLRPSESTRGKRRRKEGAFSPERNYYQVEYLGTEFLDGKWRRFRSGSWRCFENTCSAECKTLNSLAVAKNSVVDGDTKSKRPGMLAAACFPGE